MFSKIRTQAALFGLVPLVSLFVLLVFAVALQSAMERTSLLSQRSQAALSQSASLMDALTDANRDALIYAAKPNSSAYAAYRNAMRLTASRMAQLRDSAGDDAAQSARAATLGALVLQAQNILDRFVGAVRANNTVAERAIESDSRTGRLSGQLAAARTALDREIRRVELKRFRTLAGQMQWFGRTLVIGVALAIALALVTMIGFGGRIAKRLALLSRNATQLAEGASPPPLQGNDEIALLDAHYRTIFSAYQHERDVAAMLQEALLPQRLPEIAGVRVDCAYLPAAQGPLIGGDWYDVFRISETSFGISIGDVAGHGLRSATIMAMVRQAIRTATMISADPGQVLSVANRIVCADDDNGLVTAFFGALDTQTGRLRYGIGGHPPPVIVHQSGDVSMLAGEGLIFGADRRAVYTTYETPLDEGSALVLYTDGAVEAGRDYQRGVETLLAAIGDVYYNTAENIARAIQQRVFAHHESRDDSAILFIAVTELGMPRRKRSRSWSIDARAINSGRRVKRAMLWHLGEFTRPDTDLSAVELIYGELLGNVARHTPGHADVTLELEGYRAILHVADRGLPFAASNGFAPEDMAEGGRGLFLIRSLAHGVTIERTGDGNRVSVILPVTLERHVAMAPGALGLEPHLEAAP
ncbi:MAG TPA: SpoIIE family protein phosphatase [Candidatus Baltobacteraceae bacterium]|nr:SpoIIE family protein phosphatase [Candidatus Baltobacteraceae bacterium]